MRECRLRRRHTSREQPREHQLLDVIAAAEAMTPANQSFVNAIAMHDGEWFRSLSRWSFRARFAAVAEVNDKTQSHQVHLLEEFAIPFLNPMQRLLDVRGRDAGLALTCQMETFLTTVHRQVPARTNFRCVGIHFSR